VIYSGVYYDDCHPFNKLCENVDTVRSPEDLKERESALIIWGGADIHPDYYNRPMHRTTHPGGQRDKIEWSLIQRAIEMQIPIFGVCRGAQFLCAAAGGWLIQNVRGHAGHGGHDVETKDGKKFTVNSIHHQMMVPDGTDHELVAWSTERRAEKFCLKGDDAYGIDDNQSWHPPEGWKEPEFIYFPKIHGYAIQWHPEGMGSESDATKYILDYIEEKENARDHSHRVFPVCNC
jgi:gamma-glutamyl-gamma-aminobutyrate hydrolase PuuD